MRTLRQGVNTRISPPRAVHAKSLSAYFRESVLEPILYRVPVRLALPASELGTIIRDDESEPVRHLLQRIDRLVRTLQTVEITLQDHLRRHLIDNAARLSRFVPAIPQGAVCRCSR